MHSRRLILYLLLPLVASGALPGLASPGMATLDLHLTSVRAKRDLPMLRRNSDAAYRIGAMQTVYRAGVPHTDRHGNIRDRYGADSFFPRCLYHAIEGSLRVIKDAGFNCVHTYEQIGIHDIMSELRSADLQLLKHWPTDTEVRIFARDPHILGWYLDEEPTHRAFLEMARTGATGLLQQRYDAYLSRRATIKAIDPDHPVLPLESGWIPPGHQEWWERWNTSGDVVAYDHYLLERETPDSGALAERVSLAVRINRERKPVWLTVQAYAGNRIVLPTPEELRGMVFTSIVHGATGIILFAYDSWITRVWDVVGISPDPLPDYDGRGSATPEQVRRSRALWHGAAALNAELERLAPRILAPTAGLPYTVHYTGPGKTPRAIRTLLKSHGAGYTLFVSNIERAAHVARFQFSRRIASVERLGGDGSRTPITPDGSVFRDSIGPFGAGVYEIVFR
jgi:hypothetical protein